MIAVVWGGGCMREAAGLHTAAAFPTPGLLTAVCKPEQLVACTHLAPLLTRAKVCHGLAGHPASCANPTKDFFLTTKGYYRIPKNHICFENTQRRSPTIHIWCRIYYQAWSTIIAEMCFQCMPISLNFCPGGPPYDTHLCRVLKLHKSLKIKNPLSPVLYVPHQWTCMGRQTLCSA